MLPGRAGGSLECLGSINADRLSSLMMTSAISAPFPNESISVRQFIEPRTRHAAHLGYGRVNAYCYRVLINPQIFAVDHNQNLRITPHPPLSI